MVAASNAESSAEESYRIYIDENPLYTSTFTKEHATRIAKRERQMFVKRLASREYF